MSTDTKNVRQVVDYNSDDDPVVVRYNTKHKGEEVVSEYVIDSPSRQSIKRVKRAATSQLTKKLDDVPFNLRVERTLERDVEQIRMERDGMQIELVQMRDELNAHKRRCEERQRTANTFFGNKFEIHVKRNMEILTGYTVDHVVNLNEKLKGVEDRLEKQWEKSNSIVQEIKEKENARTVALDKMLAQNNK